ncbi:MAG: DNA methyltransferase [Candidatus Thorarchaeota archaeon]
MTIGDEEFTEAAGPTLEFIGDISPEVTIPDAAQILIISKDQSFLTHGIHKFPAKFFPELPRYLIKRYSSRHATVLDPMCGSGTVVLESLLSQRRGIGIDIDPMARLITKVKTTPINSDLIDAFNKTLLNETQERYVGQIEETVIPEFSYRDKWFRPFVLKELAIIRDSIEKTRILGAPDDVYDFHRVALSSIIRDVSNADPHCTRTVIRKKHIRQISPGDTLAKFSEALDQQALAMNAFVDSLYGQHHHAPILTGKSAMDMNLEDSSIDLAVTSPPYINAVDYPRTHQLEMYWLGLNEEGPLSRMKRKYIGTETVYKEEYEKLTISGYDTLDPVLEKIHAIDSRRSYIVFKFFEDMKKQLRETYRVLRPGGHYCIAIGNNLVRGHRIESQKILSEIASSDDVGFEIERSFFSGLIRHFIKIPRRERMNGEWVIILVKPT